MRNFILYLFLTVFTVLIVLELYIRIFGNYCEPWFDKKDKIVKHKPNTEGVYKTEFTNTGYFRINNEGWNSHRDYFRRQETGKQKNKFRIVIVGDSNIEGLRVSIDKTMSKILENELNKNGIPAEVYTFAFGGMHLAQAMHISRYAVNHFQPDLLLIGTMLDDFWAHSTEKKNFLNLSLDNGTVQEVLPQNYVYEENSAFSFLYFSKLIYYFDIKTKIGERLTSIRKKRICINCDNEVKDIITSSDKEKALEYIFNEIRNITQPGTINEIPFFYLKFPNIIPSNNYDYETYKSSYNIKEDQFAKYFTKNTYKIIDFEAAFFYNYKVNGQKFDFKNDYHFNEQAHKVVGLQLSGFIQQFLQK